VSGWDRPTGRAAKPSVTWFAWRIGPDGASRADFDNEVDARAWALRGGHQWSVIRREVRGGSIYERVVASGPNVLDTDPPDVRQ